MTPKSNHIVLVDDEQRMCDSLTKLLNGEGYKVTPFLNARDASEYIQKNQFDLLITDIKMPEVTGLDLLKTVKDVDDEIPVILMTGYASLDSAVEAIASGAYDYLMKPVEFAQLGLTVKRALEKREADLNRLSLMEELKISNLILHRRINEINALYEAGKSIGSTANLKELLKQIVALASNVTEAQVGSIMLLNERGKYLTIEAAIGLEKKVVDSTKLDVGKSIAGTVAETGEPLIIDNVEDHQTFRRKNKDKYGGASLLCAPMKIKNKVIGVINMANKIDGKKFDKNDLRLLSTFASQAAVAVDDANQFEKTNRRLTEFEILHEINREMPEIKNLASFRETLISKLNRVFKIDYCLWFSWDKENAIFITDGATGWDGLPITSSGKIDLKQIKWDEVILKPDKPEKLNFNDIPKLTKKLAALIKANENFPSPSEASVAIPIFRLGEPAFVVFLGAFGEDFYDEDDISLASLVISQSAILFERENTLLNATRLLTMGNMISEISHDLRRPLTTIKAGLQVIQGKIVDSLQNPQLFDTVLDEVHRMNELVRELVDFSNPKKYQTEKIDLKNLVEKSYELMRPELDKKKISFEYDFDDADFHVIINKNQILEIFLNLMQNAIDSMEQGGQLKVKGCVEIPDHKSKEYLAVKFIDNGCGISKENQSQIFDRYFTTKETGTGLGLAVVERIISAHNGTLSVKSEEGKGTVFTLFFEAE